MPSAVTYNNLLPQREELLLGDPALFLCCQLQVEVLKDPGKNEPHFNVCQSRWTRKEVQQWLRKFTNNLWQGTHLIESKISLVSILIGQSLHRKLSVASMQLYREVL